MDEEQNHCGESLYTPLEPELRLGEMYKMQHIAYGRAFTVEIRNHGLVLRKQVCWRRLERSGIFEYMNIQARGSLLKTNEIV